MKSRTKKWGLIAGTIFLLIVSVYANYRINSKPAQSQEVDDGRVVVDSGAKVTGEAADADNAQVFGMSDYFEAFRQNREEVRRKETEYLDSIIHNEKTDGETLQDAQQRKLELVEQMEKELIVEGILCAKGFDDAVVTFREGSVNVVVERETLSAEDVAKILDIVMRETGESAENVKVTGKS